MEKVANFCDAVTVAGLAALPVIFLANFFLRLF